MTNTTEYNKEYYGRNKQKRKEQIINRLKATRDEIQKLKIERGCSICGYKKSARALQFHHTGDAKKEHTIARMVGQGRAISSILKEIDKCVILCANCHLELHEQLDMQASSSG